MAELSTIARPYADALFEAARDEHDGLASWSDLLAELAQVASLDSVREAMTDPRLDGPQRVELFDARPDDALDAAAAASALNTLPPDQREAVVLRIWSGLTLAEVAGVTGVAVSTAFARYRAGLAEVRRAMESSTCKTTNDSKPTAPR